eukprot:CAMPEP_0184979708 /NCGR_PEP_ID=MMETSP1098-20130426/9880_1 /TAXON_ID=89044 /ORGANISM="Spumella elongata, Strain CCAP 955/1" /LENGTH=244 /DNA_ID=CAMNT_0027503039 /DNA_START=85 /DNA_END=819 /DNA_ORIENTATION=-
MVRAFFMRRQATAGVALNGVLEGHHVVKPVRGDIQHLSRTQNGVDGVHFGKSPAGRLLEVTPIDNRMAVRWMLLVGDDAQVLAGPRGVQNVPFFALEHRHHITPRVVMRLRDHAAHAEAALDALVGHHIRDEEVVLLRGEGFQIFRDKRTALVLGGAAGHEIIVFSGVVHSVLICGLGDLQPPIEVHVDDLCGRFVACATASSPVPIHEMVVFGLFNVASAPQIGAQLIVQIVVRPQVCNFREL